MSALAPKAEMCGAARDVRYALKVISSLFDHQVGAAKQWKRYGKAEGLGASKATQISTL
jgi:hypothetical protein